MNFKLIDLTHTLTPEVASWNGSCGFQHDVKLDYEDCTTEVKFRVQQIKMHAGIGTHMDAPAHCIPGGKTIDELPLEQLVAPCVVIDVSAKAHERYSVSVQDITNFEAQHGKIPKDTFVIIYTGWDQFWNEPEKYRNNLVFPNISIEATELLLERNIIGLGIDTLSPDRPEEGYHVHQLLLGNGKYIVENVANAKQLPPTGSHSLALPIKTLGGTEAPIRVIGMIC